MTVTPVLMDPCGDWTLNGLSSFSRTTVQYAGSNWGPFSYTGRDGTPDGAIRTYGRDNVSGKQRWERGIADITAGATRVIFQVAIMGWGAHLLDHGPNAGGSLYGGMLIIAGPAGLYDTSDTVAFTFYQGKVLLTQGKGSESQFGTAFATSTSSNLLRDSQWSVVEINVLPGLSSTGRVSVRVNNILAIDEAPCSVALDRFGFGLERDMDFGGAYIDLCFDDVVISTSDQGTVEWLGDRRVHTLTPNDLGSETGGYSAGADSGPRLAGMVDRFADANYLADGDRLTATVDASVLPENVDVAAVQPRFRAAGTGNLASLVKAGASEALGAAQAVASDPAYVIGEAVALKPGGGAWAQADLDTIEMGVERS